MGRPYRSEFDLEPEKTDLTKETKPEYTRDWYVPPTKQSGYTFWQYVIEAEYVFPAWTIVFVTVLFLGSILLQALRGATIDSVGTVLFTIVALPVLISLASVFVKSVEKMNEREVERHQPTA